MKVKSISSLRLEGNSTLNLKNIKGGASNAGTKPIIIRPSGNVINSMNFEIQLDGFGG